MAFSSSVINTSVFSWMHAALTNHLTSFTKCALHSVIICSQTWNVLLAYSSLTMLYCCSSCVLPERDLLVFGISYYQNLPYFIMFKNCLKETDHWNILEGIFWTAIISMLVLISWHICKFLLIILGCASVCWQFIHCIWNFNLSALSKTQPWNCNTIIAILSAIGSTYTQDQSPEIKKNEVTSTVVDQVK